MGEFLLDNIALVALFLASGALLVWPDLSLFSGGAPSVGTMEATRLMNQPGALVLDVREDAEYAAGHLPGAVPLDIDRDLSGPIGPGRHPLPAPEDFAALMGERGFGDDDLIVAYDDARGIYAARLWWMLRWIGHPGARLLDGGLQAWVAAGLPFDTATPCPEPTVMTVLLLTSTSRATITWIVSRKTSRTSGGWACA